MICPFFTGELKVDVQLSQGPGHLTSDVYGRQGIQFTRRANALDHGAAADFDRGPSRRFRSGRCAVGNDSYGGNQDRSERVQPRLRVVVRAGAAALRNGLFAFVWTVLTDSGGHLLNGH